MKPLTRCPICGSRRIRRVCEAVTFRRRAPVTIPNLCFDRCEKCGEAFFDHQANQKIDAAVFGTGRRLPKRKSA